MTFVYVEFENVFSWIFIDVIWFFWIYMIETVNMFLTRKNLVYF